MRRFAKFLKYNQEINYTQIAYFLAVVLVIAFLFYTMVKNLIFEEVDGNIKSVAAQTQNHLQAYMADVDRTAAFYSDFLVKNGQLTVNFTNFSELLSSQSIINSVELVDFSDSILKSIFRFNIDSSSSIPSQRIVNQMWMFFDDTSNNTQWKFFPETNSPHYTVVYARRITQTSMLLFYYDWTWFQNYIERYRIAKDLTLFIYRDDGHVIYFPGFEINTLVENSQLVQRVETRINKRIENSNYQPLFDGITFDRFRFNAADGKFLSHVVKDPYSGWIISVHQSYNSLFQPFFLFFRTSGLLLMLVIGLGIFLLTTTNKKRNRNLDAILARIYSSSSIQVKPKPNEDDESIIIRAIELMQNQLKHYAANIERNSQERLKLENEMRLAKKLQKNIMPSNRLTVDNESRFEIYSISESAYDIGGDLHDYFMVDKNRLLFTVGDVSGKGIPAALFMIFAHTLLRSVGQSQLPVNEIVNAMNNRLIEDNISDLFVTLFVGILDLNTGELNYCNAAHCFPVLVRSQGVIEDLVQSHGIPVGLYSNRNYSQSSIKLNHNDTLILYSDGLIEAKDENGMTYSEDVLKYNLVGTWFDSPEGTVNKVLDSLNSFRGNKRAEDDLTIMALKFKREG
jgi:serine phosphatase RsbU (regulator of sigma subunit)